MTPDCGSAQEAEPGVLLQAAAQGLLLLRGHLLVVPEALVDDGKLEGVVPARGLPGLGLLARQVRALLLPLGLRPTAAPRRRSPTLRHWGGGRNDWKPPCAFSGETHSVGLEMLRPPPDERLCVGLIDGMTHHVQGRVPGQGPDRAQTSPWHMQAHTQPHILWPQRRATRLAELHSNITGVMPACDHSTVLCHRPAQG